MEITGKTGAIGGATADRAFNNAGRKTMTAFARTDDSAFQTRGRAAGQPKSLINMRRTDKLSQAVFNSECMAKKTLGILAVGLSALALAGCNTSGSGGASPSAPSHSQVLEGVTVGEELETRSLSGSTEAARIVSSENGVTVIEVGPETYTFTNAQEVRGVTVSDDRRLGIANNDDLGLPDGEHVKLRVVAAGSNLGLENSLVTDIAVATDGDLTPVANLPASAEYRGSYMAATLTSVNDAGDAAGSVDSGGAFSATATFGATNTITGTLNDGTADIGAISGTITDNRFSATVNGQNGVTGSGTLAGGFYGPGAEEIAGSGSGQFQGEDTVIAVIGQKQ